MCHNVFLFQKKYLSNDHAIMRSYDMILKGEMGSEATEERRFVAWP